MAALHLEDNCDRFSKLPSSNRMFEGFAAIAVTSGEESPAPLKRDARPADAVRAGRAKMRLRAARRVLFKSGNNLYRVG